MKIFCDKMCAGRGHTLPPDMWDYAGDAMQPALVANVETRVESVVHLASIIPAVARTSGETQARRHTERSTP